MFILDTPIKGNKNNHSFDSIYKLKWMLIDKNGNTLTDSNWVNKQSFINNDGWDHIKWSESILKHKNNIDEVHIYCDRDGIAQVAISEKYSMIKRVSYIFQNFINTNYTSIVGILLETNDQKIEWMIDGNVYIKNIEV